MVDATAPAAGAPVRRGLAAVDPTIVCDPARSHDSYLYDVANHRELLDLAGFGGSRALAFDHPRLLEPSFRDALARAALLDAPGAALGGPERGTLPELFAKVPLAGAFEDVFFVDAAAAAVDSAVLLALEWKRRKGAVAGGGNGTSRVVCFRGGSHGDGGCAYAGTAPTLDWPRIGNPVVRAPPDEAALAEIERRERAALEDLEAVFEADSGAVAAVLVEPIQCEAGDLFFRTELLQALRTATLRHDALLILDETRTGFGASGRWWDFEVHGLRPDLLLFGTRAQAWGVAAGERLTKVDSIRRALGSSAAAGGRLTDLMRCKRTIEVIQEEDLLANATAMGGYLLRLLRDLSAAESAVSGARGRGLIAAFDLPSPEERDRVAQACLESGLLVLPTGERTISLRPALDITADALGRAAAQLDAGLRRAYGRKP